MQGRGKLNWDLGADEETIGGRGGEGREGGVGRGGEQLHSRWRAVLCCQKRAEGGKEEAFVEEGTQGKAVLLQNESKHFFCMSFA